MCGQCAFLKEKYYKEGNGGGKEYYCEYLKEYVCGSCRGCSNYKKDDITIYFYTIQFHFLHLLFGYH